MTCRCGCGRPARGRHGLSDACRKRWLYHDCPEQVPEPSNPGNDHRKADRLEDYLELRSWGVTRQEAAARIGVCLKTIERYDAEIRSAA